MQNHDQQQLHNFTVASSLWNKAPLDNLASVHWGLRAFIYHAALIKVPTQHPGHLITLILLSFSHSLVDLLPCLRSSSWRSVSKLHFSDRCVHIRICNTLHTEISHHPSTTMCDNWYEVFLLTCCVCFSPGVALCIFTKHLHFGLIFPGNIVPDVLQFVQTQLCKPKPYLFSLVLIVMLWTLTFNSLVVWDVTLCKLYNEE